MYEELEAYAMKKVLVAGATGYLGKYVALEFKRSGYYVRVLARDPEKLNNKGNYLEPPIGDIVDDVFTGEVTKPETLEGIFDDIDIVFSSIGITRQKDDVTFMDVDYQGNKNLLDLAKGASMKKFIFVSVFQAEMLNHIEIVKAREKFVEDLSRSGLGYTIIRPTGYFSDMTQYFKMAHSGRAYLLGKGKCKMNPIYGMDLATVCVKAVNREQSDISIGGPYVYTHEEIAELAFYVLKKRPKIFRIPNGFMNILLKVIYPFNKHMHSLLSFLSASMQMDLIAPKTGSHGLKQYYQQYVRRKMKK